MQTIDLKHTAYHEAGHAVAHFRLNVQQECVTIKPHGDNLGSSMAEGKDHVLDAEDAPTQVLCYCAGYAALIANGNNEGDAIRGADDDFENTEELLEKWPESLTGTLNDWKGQSVALMSAPENIRAVDFVAKSLLKYETLQADYLEMLVELADSNITEEEWQRFLAIQFPEMLTP